jgi:hypothetical protein
MRERFADSWHKELFGREVLSLALCQPRAARSGRFSIQVMGTLDPEFAPRAEAELQALGKPVGSLLQDWLRGLVSGSVPAYKVRELLGAPRVPPWQWTHYVDGIVVVFRYLSKEELIERSLQNPKLLIARITSESKLAEAAEELLRNAPREP